MIEADQFINESMCHCANCTEHAAQIANIFHTSRYIEVGVPTIRVYRDFIIKYHTDIILQIADPTQNIYEYIYHGKSVATNIFQNIYRRKKFLHYYYVH